jgi:hypothetical protein
MIHMRVTHQDALNLDLFPKTQLTGERTSIQSKYPVDQKARGAMLGRLSAVTTEYGEVHKALES